MERPLRIKIRKCCEYLRAGQALFLLLEKQTVWFDAFPVALVLAIDKPHFCEYTVTILTKVQRSSLSPCGMVSFLCLSDASGMQGNTDSVIGSVFP